MSEPINETPQQRVARLTAELQNAQTQVSSEPPVPPTHSVESAIKDNCPVCFQELGVFFDRVARALGVTPPVHTDEHDQINAENAEAETVDISKE